MYPQQSSGPGLLKTAVVAGAAGLGGAALYNGELMENILKLLLRLSFLSSIQARSQQRSS